MSIKYDIANTDETLQQILALQKKNLERSISSDELQQEGFVTVDHDFALLKAMNHPYPHVIAQSEGKVIGYTLVMLRTLEKRIPVLIPMFEKINGLSYRGQNLQASSYFIMGQVCIDKAFRGQGIFQKLYLKLKEEMQDDFQYCITEVAVRNPRSMRAHQKVGFENLLQYKDENNEEWVILIWPLQT